MSRRIAPQMGGEVVSFLRRLFRERQAADPAPITAEGIAKVYMAVLWSLGTAVPANTVQRSVLRAWWLGGHTLLEGAIKHPYYRGSRQLPPEPQQTFEFMDRTLSAFFVAVKVHGGFRRWLQDRFTDFNPMYGFVKERLKWSDDRVDMHRDLNQALYRVPNPIPEDFRLAQVAQQMCEYLDGKYSALFALLNANKPDFPFDTACFTFRLHRYAIGWVSEPERPEPQSSLAFSVAALDAYQSILLGLSSEQLIRELEAYHSPEYRGTDLDV